MITILSGVRGDTRRYRTLHPYEQLCLAGVACQCSHLMDPQLGEKLRSAQVVILHRVAYDGYVARLLDGLKARGALVVLDTDDFLYDPAIMRWIDSPDFQDPVRARIYRQELLRHRQTLERCDGVTVSTDALAKMMEPFGLPVRVQRNAFSLEMLALSDKAVGQREPRSGRVVIGYASGTRTHDRDFQMIRPALRRVLERYPEAELWLMGDLDTGEAWEGLAERVKVFPRVAWRDLPARLALLDINLAPLVPESPFNQAKSEIKYMEAALVRVPTIASRTDAFAHAIRSGENGFLAGSLEEWQAHLERLVSDAPAREAVGAAAHAHVLERYAPWVRGPELLETLAEFSRAAGKAAEASFLTGAFDPAVSRGMPDAAATQRLLERFYFSAADEARPTLRDMAWYSVRNRGAGTLLGQVWVFFRRKLAPIFPFRKGNAP